MAFRPINHSLGSNYDMMIENWERKTNEDGVAYYVNVHRKVTSWIHPYVDKVLEDFINFNDIKYAAYRTAMKLRFLQLELGLSWISLKSLQDVFALKMHDTNGYNPDSIMSGKEIVNAVHKVLEISDNLNIHSKLLNKSSEVIMSLLLEIFDTSRSGKVPARSIRIALVAFCSAKLSDKYRFFFNEISNDNGQIQRDKFLYLVYDLMQITELLKENTAFGTNVSAVVNSCLNEQNVSSRTKSEDVFYSWLLQEPISIIWLPTLHRVIATENVTHNIQCCACGANPLVGFRYRCMQCLSYDLCQSCFFRGHLSQSHRLKHPMQEYCFPTTKKDNTKALLKIMRNKMSKRHRRTKIKYLPIDDDSLTGSVFQWLPRSLVPDPRDSFCGSTDSGLAGSSGNGDNATEEDCVDEDDIVSIKKWCKPVELLGEPCNSSSPCLQQEVLPKKPLDTHQEDMAQMIEQLQEENKFLRQKLLEGCKCETQRHGSHYHLENNNVESPMDKEKRSQDPMTEITTDEPISPIVSFNQNDLVPNDTGITNISRNESVDVLQIVGMCTPIQSSFCKEKKASRDSNESGISGDNGSNSSIQESKVIETKAECYTNVVDCDDGFFGSSQPFKLPLKNPTIHILQTAAFTDTETESTTSNGLEYTYSDMSLKSEATSHSGSLKKGAVTFDCEETKTFNNPEQSDKKVVHKDGVDNDTLDFQDSSATFGGASSNGTLQSDAFKLCQMKFDKSYLSSRQCNPHDSSSQPKLIYISTTASNDLSRPSTNPSNSSRTKRAGRDKLDKSSLVYSNFSFDLSEIPRYESTWLPKQDFTSLERRKTIEPVYMSTPVLNNIDRLSSPPIKSTLKKKSSSTKSSVPKIKQDKENITPLMPSSHDPNSIRVDSHKEPSFVGVTPKSAIPPKLRQRILLSVDPLQSTNRSYSCNDLTTDGDIGMTTMFDKAEHGHTLGLGCQSLALEDKAELEKILARVDIGNSRLSEVCHEDSNSSMLQAVMNVGDAMADFVHATAVTQAQRESTYL